MMKVVVGARRSAGVCALETADFFGVLTTSQPSLSFMEKGLQNRKYHLGGSCVEEKALLV